MTKQQKMRDLKRSLKKRRFCFRLFQNCCLCEGIVVLCRVVLFIYVKAEYDRVQGLYIAVNKEKEACGQRIEELEDKLTEKQSDIESKQVTKNRLLRISFLFRI